MGDIESYSRLLLEFCIFLRSFGDVLSIEGDSYDYRVSSFKGDEHFEDLSCREPF